MLAVVANNSHYRPTLNRAAGRCVRDGMSVFSWQQKPRGRMSNYR